MIDVFKRILGKEATQAESFTQPQREALLDLLLLGMYADNMLSMAENQFLDDEMEELVWDSLTSPSAYLSAAIHRVRTAEEDIEKRNALLQSIKERFGDVHGKQGALLVLKDLLASDGTAEQEQTFLTEIQRMFVES